MTLSLLRKENTMKIIKLFFCLSITLNLFFISSALSDTQNLDSIVAIVNTSVVTQSELNNAVNHAKAQMAAGNNPQALDNAKLSQMVLQQLIDEKLELELAKHAKISVSDTEVNHAIDNIAERNHITLSTLKSKLQDEKTTFAAYKKMIRDQMIIQKVQQAAVGAKVQITTQDMQDFKTKYASQLANQQEYKIIDVLASSSKDAAKIAAQWKAGKNPDASTSTQTQNSEWQSANQLPALFLTQLQSMKPGDISSPIQAPNGYHVIKLIAQRGNMPTKIQLKQMVFGMKMQEAVKNWLVELRKTAYIKILNNQ